MKYWYDTEFIEDGRTIDLISIGVVAEDGRELYLQNSECAFGKANEWVRENVLVHLKHFGSVGPNCFSQEPRCAGGICPYWFSTYGIREKLLEFVGADKPEFWGYYSAYDHVALCQLFGSMMDLPKGWPKYTRDLKQWCDQLGNPRLPEQGKGEHHALADAKWNREAYYFLESYEREREREAWLEPKVR